MSNPGVNTGFAKCFIFFMAVVILLQGVVYLLLSIWGMTQRECANWTSDISRNPFQFVMGLIYFLDADCGNPSVEVPGISDALTLDVDFNKAELVVNRTVIILFTYAVISSLWIVTSLAVIATLCFRITKTVNGLCFWPWFLVIMAGSILDAVATGYYINDIINTTSVVKTFQYLGITADDKAIEVLSNFDVYFVTPAVIMTCISSRVIFIWLLNIIGSSFCLSLSNTLSKRNSSKQSSINSVATASTAPITNIPQQSIQEVSSVQSQQLTQPPTLEKRYNSVLPVLDIQRYSQTPPQTNQQSVPYNVQSNTVPITNLYPTAPSTRESQANSDYHNTEPQRNASQYQQELSPTSPLNNRYSTNNESFQFPAQNQRVSEELRGQLPWSYTSMPPPVSKKSPMPAYPEIPAPDYGH